jgi:CDP-2,3-bis-(O-geranylgeranyl)-sn-glycerol synthase
MVHLMTRGLDALLLVIVANLAPWAGGRLMQARWRTPLDGGAELADGSRLLGDHKTWRGLSLGVLACAVAARLLGRPLLLGAAFGALALGADAASSFTKRRLGLRPGTEIPGLDQLPEALVPLLVLARPLGLRLTDAVAVASVFMLLDLATLRVRQPALGSRR